MKVFRTDIKGVKEKSVGGAIDILVNTLIPVTGDIMIYNGLKNIAPFSKHDNKKSPSNEDDRKLNTLGKLMVFYIISGKYLAYANIAATYINSN